MSAQQLPEKFLERLKEFIPQEKLSIVLDSFSKERSITFRVNTIKASSEEVAKELRDLGFDIEHFSWYDDAFVLCNRSKTDLMNTNIYKNGLIYIQNVSSMIPALILDPKPGETVLDMAASPGSKTTQISCLMHNTGTIIANDKSPKRLFKLLENIKNQGVTNVKTSAIPGEFLWRKYPEYFDRVLVDVPCTMEGRFTVQDPASFEDWSLRKVKELSNLQKWMLRSAISCTKVGGVIVYSTCALSPEENEEVIDWVLKKYSNSVQVEFIHISYKFSASGIYKWKTREYAPELAKTVRIYPDSLWEGFYIAKLRKIHTSFA